MRKTKIQIRKTVLRMRKTKIQIRETVLPMRKAILHICMHLSV